MAHPNRVAALPLLLVFKLISRSTKGPGAGTALPRPHAFQYLPFPGRTPEGWPPKFGYTLGPGRKSEADALDGIRQRGNKCWFWFSLNCRIERQWKGFALCSVFSKSIDQIIDRMQINGGGTRRKFTILKPCNPSPWESRKCLTCKKDTFSVSRWQIGKGHYCKTMWISSITELRDTPKSKATFKSSSLKQCFQNVRLKIPGIKPGDSNRQPLQSSSLCFNSNAHNRQSPRKQNPHRNTPKYTEVVSLRMGPHTTEFTAKLTKDRWILRARRVMTKLKTLAKNVDRTVTKASTLLRCESSGLCSSNNAEIMNKCSSPYIRYYKYLWYLGFKA